MKRKFKKSTNPPICYIYKTNNHLSPENIEHKQDNNIWRWKCRSSLGTGRTCGVVKRIYGILLPPPPFLIILSPTTIKIYMYNKTILSNTTQTRFHSQRPHTITKINENIYTDSTIAESVNVRS